MYIQHVCIYLHTVYMEDVQVFNGIKISTSRNNHRVEMCKPTLNVLNTYERLMATQIQPNCVLLCRACPVRPGILYPWSIIDYQDPTYRILSERKWSRTRPGVNIWRNRMVIVRNMGWIQDQDCVCVKGTHLQEAAVFHVKLMVNLKEEIVSSHTRKSLSFILPTGFFKFQRIPW